MIFKLKTPHLGETPFESINLRESDHQQSLTTFYFTWKQRGNLDGRMSLSDSPG